MNKKFYISQNRKGTEFKSGLPDEKLKIRIRAKKSANCEYKKNIRKLPQAKKFKFIERFPHNLTILYKYSKQQENIKNS